MGRLEGKVAIITGAGRGTGEATARMFAGEGAKVVVADIREDAVAGVAADLAGDAMALGLDVGSEDSWKEGVAKVVERFGTVDILVNNAALLHLASIADTQVADFERLMRVNQMGAFLGIRTVAETMKEKKSGSIVNVSSIDGMRAQTGIVAYSSTKWALRGITRVAALELGRHGIRVNAVCPEAGSPDMVQPYMPEGVDAASVLPHMQPNLRSQKHRTQADLVGDVAKMVLFLACDDSASCTGADFLVDGGNLAGRIVKGTPGAD
ncbi:MAG: SDR family oxidoreductase [Candidatus Binatia bacterium]|nr:SDR family oxidoreductase [Candidatus Binatia bacterium]